MKRVLIFLTGLLAFGEYHLAVEAQQRVHRIGLLNHGERPSGFFRGLSDVGYAEGKNIFIEARNADGKVENLPPLVADLAERKVSVIVASGPTAVAAAAKMTKTIPIVMVGGGDPVLRGFVKSLSVPGGNVTGLSSIAKGSGPKRLEILKEVIPTLRHVAVLNPRTIIAEDLTRTAKILGIELHMVGLRSAADLDNALARIGSLRPGAFITIREIVTVNYRKQIVDYGLKLRLPSMFESEEFVRAGGLISYGVNHTAQWPRAAVFVDKILRGANPAILPVEPPQLELVLNLATAKKLGITIPPEILLEANGVIR